MTQPIYAVYGASGCGRSVMPLARVQVQAMGVPLQRLVFIDDAPLGKQVNGHEVLTWVEFLAQPATQRSVVIAIASSTMREQVSAKFACNDVQPWTVSANHIVCMDSVIIGEGAILSPFVTLTSNIRIGRHFQANLYSYVEHDCVIGDFVTFAPGVKCNGNIIIEDHAYIGSGAIIKHGSSGNPIVIGRGAVVGMGAVVTKSIPPGVTVVGNPARPLVKS